MEAQAGALFAVQSETTTAAPVASAPWNLAMRISFRFFFAYFMVYNFPFPLSQIPGSDLIFHFYASTVSFNKS